VREDGGAGVLQDDYEMEEEESHDGGGSFDDEPDEDLPFDDEPEEDMIEDLLSDEDENVQEEAGPSHGAPGSHVRAAPHLSARKVSRAHLPARKASRAQRKVCKLQRKSSRTKTHWSDTVARQLGGQVKFHCLLCNTKAPVGEKTMQSHRKSGGPCQKKHAGLASVFASAQRNPPPPRQATV